MLSAVEALLFIVKHLLSAIFPDVESFGEGEPLDFSDDFTTLSLNFVCIGCESQITLNVINSDCRVNALFVVFHV